MGTVTITAVEYTVFGTHTGSGSLTEYAGGSLAYATIFAAATSDNQKRAMVEAKRAIARLDFEDDTHGDPTTAGLPQAIIDASYEYALAGLVDSSIFTVTTTEDKIKRIDAKGTEIEWFGPRDGGRVPGRVMELLAPYLAGASESSLGDSYVSDGVDCGSRFDDCDAYKVSGGG
jgi:hypothetical protein